MIIDTKSKFDLFMDWFSTQDECAFDTETKGLHGPLVGMSFANSRGKGYYLPVAHETGEPQLDMSYVEKPLQEVFNKCVLVGWNMLYEKNTMFRYHGITIPHIHEAQIMAHLLDENLPTSLKNRAVIERVVRKTTSFKDVVNFRKGETAAEISIPIMAPYAIQDAVLTHLLKEKFLDQIECDPILLECYNKELQLVDIIHEMFVRGFKVDVEMIEEIKRQLLVKIDEVEQLIYHEAGEEFNMKSNKQKIYILYEKMAIPVPAKCYTPKGAPQTGKSALEKLRREFPIAKNMLIFSKLQKVVSSFTDSIIDSVDGYSRIRPSFNQTGTVSGRFSCRSPNLQQMPKGGGIRRAFICDPGYKLIVADYSQLELRVAAHFSQDPVMMEAFRTGLDLHTLTASKLFHIPFDDVDKDGPERFTAKTINFGIVYGMGAKEDLGVTWDHIADYFKIHRRLKLYINAHNKRMKEIGFTRTLWGRKRRPAGLDDDEWKIQKRAERQGFSAHIQGSAGDVVKEAMINNYTSFKRDSIIGFCIAQIHDELIYEVKDEHVEEAMRIIQYEMENSIPLRVPLEAQPNCADNWEDAKKGKVSTLSITQIIDEFASLDDLEIEPEQAASWNVPDQITLGIDLIEMHDKGPEA